MQRLDSTKAIWEHLYMVSIPELASRTLDDIRLYGVAITGIKEIDDDAKTRYMNAMRTIDDMVEYYRRGVPVRVCNYSDTAEIYKAINAHLYAWKTQLEHGVNIGNAPMDDLILMDEFANKVYDHAKYVFTQEFFDNPFIAQMSSSIRLNIKNFFKRTANDPVEEEDPNIIAKNGMKKDRDGLSDFFKDHLVATGRRY